LKNIILASYGVRLDRSTNQVVSFPKNNYGFNGHTYETNFFFLALCKLLEPTVKIDEVHLFLSKESKKGYESVIMREASEIGVGIKITEISSATTTQEVWAGFDSITETFQALESSEEYNVYLDITNGYRHLPLISFVSLLYLESSKQLKLKGAYYGALDAKDNNANLVPVFDLSNLVKIVKGSFAVEQFEKTGHLSPLRDFIEDVLKDHTDKHFKIADFDELSENIMFGLTIEAGLSARKRQNSLENKLPETKTEVKVLGRLVKKIIDKLDEISISDSKRKDSLELDQEELERQLRFVKWHLEIGNIPTALMLLREWIINRCFLVDGKNKQWLLKKERGDIENLLNKYSLKEQKSSQKKENIISVWLNFGDRRNEYAHAGFRDKNVIVNTGRNTAQEFYDLCVKHLNNDDFWRLTKSVEGTEKVLISPMGASIGLLYSALMLTKPDRVIVLTSEKFKDRVFEVCEKANFSDKSKVSISVIKDPFSGFDESDALASETCAFVDNPAQIIVNLTGGTTAMQWAMQAIYEKLHNDFKGSSANLTRAAFIDRRPSTEQQSDPYRVGEMVNIDKI